MNLSALPKGILSPETNLGDENDTGACSLLDYRLSQSVLPKRPTLGRVVAEVVGEAVVVVVVDDALSPASSSLPEALGCSRPALLDLTGIRKRS